MSLDLVGLVVAAGGGSRFGGPKALARDHLGEPWLVRAVTTLTEGGCDGVVVVLGPSAGEARALMPEGVTVVVADRWAEGMSASLDAGIAALPEADAALITLVDLPGLPVEVVQRVVDAGDGRTDLVRAVYDGEPGHPVLLGRDHWAAFRDALEGDHGGRSYLEQHGVTRVECGDLFSGADVDHR
jgi:CTP:molybdopterin cytidylyltransferase MocA